ncbi:MAG: hypothetical protein J7559_08530 [Cohnella sp.]|nr:hypothetical protein [Cohnella sp.]
MAVVRNLMIRIGADYSSADKAMAGATSRLNRFDKDVSRTTRNISGRRGLGGISGGFKDLSSSVSSSLSQIRGARGFGGIASSIKSLTPALGSASAGFGSFGASARAAGGAVGRASLAIGGLVAALGLATVGLYKASQPAVKFEADLGRLNMQLKGNSKEFINWARAQGLAKSTTVELGATYATLLSSFIHNNAELANQTKNIVNTTRVVASATGRTIEDTLERMRSGLLGNTEAIEDLGIFVNVAMIESTAAFQKFANGRHWDQLDFRTQQQIRLQAILEQANKRYGDTIQNNVMSKQTMLMEQLKDVKLNLSQAFLPIWDAILPALTALAKGISEVTEGVARLMYFLRGWDYEQRTSGTDQQTDAVTDQSDAYSDLAKSAKSARKEVAAFDQLNLIGDSSTGTGGSGIGGPGVSQPTPGGSSGSGGGGWPPAVGLMKRWRINFDKPNPPDAGIGAVATTVSNTVNNLVAQTKLKLAQMWLDLKTLTQLGIAEQLTQWSLMGNMVSRAIVPTMVSGVLGSTAGMWAQLLLQARTNGPLLQSQINTNFSGVSKSAETNTSSVVTSWKNMWTNLLAGEIEFRPLISAEWEKLKSTIASLKASNSTAQTSWTSTLAAMLAAIKTNRPLLQTELGLVGKALTALKSPLSNLEKDWSTSMSNIENKTSTSLSKVLSKIGETITSWTNMQKVLGSSSSTAAASSSSSSTASGSLPNFGWDSIGKGAAEWAKANPTTSSAASASSSSWNPFSGLSFSGIVEQATNMFSKESLIGAWDLIKGEAQKPENKVAFEIYSTVMPAAKAKGVISAAPEAITAVKKWWDNLTKLGSAIPAFANGAVVYGPTLAMVGDNKGASHNPEVISPLSELESIMGGGDSPEMIAILRQILTAVKENRSVQAVIAESEIGRAAINSINSTTRRTGRNPLNI